MAASLLRRIGKPFHRLAWKPLIFPTKGIPVIPSHQKVEEETIPGYIASRYYPVRLGQIFQNRYQVVGKLGFGITSTVWLARDLDECQHVALKLYVQAEPRGNELNTELDVYKRIANSPSHHPGHSAVRSVLDSFSLIGSSGGQHRCLVHVPLWASALTIKHANPIGKLPQPVVAFLLKRLFLALDFLHTECRVAHTDIKGANILLPADPSVLTKFEDDEIETPSPRKEVDGGIVYLSRAMRAPKDFGAPVLCDFGSAVALDDGRVHREDIQPDVYRCPEVILDVPWTYSVDVWNVGCMVWDAFQGEHLFTGRDPEHGVYRGRAHLAEMIALLGPPPERLLCRANLKSKFFSEEGVFSAGNPLPSPRTLEDRETTLHAAEEHKEDREMFLRFMRKMLQWEPERRSSPRELAEDEWIVKHTSY